MPGKKNLPFPTQQILLRDQPEVADGDRKSQREGWPAGEGDVPQARAAAPQERRVAVV